MKYDLSADPSSQETRRVVAKEILGWKRFVMAGEAWYFDDSKPGSNGIKDKKFPDFLHDSAWTGPLWMVLVGICEKQEYGIRMYVNSLVIVRRVSEFGTPIARFDIEDLPNIAIAQAIQAVEEKE